MKFTSSINSPRYDGAGGTYKLLFSNVLRYGIGINRLINIKARHLKLGYSLKAIYCSYPGYGEGD